MPTTLTSEIFSLKNSSPMGMTMTATATLTIKPVKLSPAPARKTRIQPSSMPTTLSATSGDAAVCPNEDLNRNGVLEDGEDLNNDSQLWPRKPDVIVSLLQSKTGSDGTAILQIQYAKDHGSWVDALITVAASGVAGSEGRAVYLAAPVPVPASSLDTRFGSPAFLVGPYGISTSCADPR